MVLPSQLVPLLFEIAHSSTFAQGFNSPLPVSLANESKKAANILRSFTKQHQANGGLDFIPQSILSKAHGFAIFSVVKAGFLFSARAGSGVVVARLADGSEFW